MDEPFVGLDPKAVFDIKEVSEEIRPPACWVEDVPINLKQLFLVTLWDYLQCF